ncbi:hypothetical protein CONPUDRAFT_90354 [Coniophora puteana RWD-64-598 SS2]|uniref:Extracellular membrane protein CFEM domain-containing protein n=1 Tax=Coniophora puteana (strain RWD-64-598) TaxID=741705 RepID=A0A5M3MQT5_CONPW|nr:uncharacterized protein CONPUDRAFT_90354 [Coniophora puteana RWD-64-598 SS2]EIW81416.1 hypothetical protein CONPUDRAFT_90354 [Coniophora puteana RWD-64-598 SS2]
MVQLSSLIFIIGGASYVIANQIGVTNIPDQCQSTCNFVGSLSDCGTNASCFCSSNVTNNFQSCMNCIAAANSSLESEVSAAVSGYNDGCGKLGAPSVTVSSSNSSSVKTMPGTGSTSTASSGGASSSSSPSSSGSSDPGSSSSSSGNTGGAAAFVASSGLAAIAAMAGAVLAL